jgi:altronate dehydratase large subunit
VNADHEQTRRTFVNTAVNPNIARTVVVGLGCEYVQSDERAADAEALDLPVQELSI